MLIGSILGGIILGGLISTIIAFLILKVSDIIHRFKERNRMRTDAKVQLATIFGNPEYVSGITGISIDELKHMMGEEGLMEVPVTDGQVDTDKITILKAQEQDEKLRNILENNGGVIKLVA